MGLRVSLTRRPSSFRRTSANDRPEETLTYSTAIVCDVTEYCVVACVMSAPVSPAVFKRGEAAHRHMVTTSRRACRVPQATVSQRRRRVAVRAPTELGFAAAFRATSARPQRRYAVEQPTADGNLAPLTSSRQPEVKPDGENQSVGSSRAPDARADPRCCCCLGHRLVPRSL
jgi:hypothetical protein